MIVVRVELWPGGIEALKETLGTAAIANDGSGNRQRGNYDVRLLKFGIDDPHDRRVRSVWKRGRVEDWPRRGSPWDLVRRAISAAIGGQLP